MTSIIPELQSLAPSAIIELFELHTVTALHGTNDIYRFHSGTNLRQAAGDIVWNGLTYQRFPIEVDGFEYSGTQLPRPTLRVANLFGVITSVLLNVNALTPGNDLIGAKVIRIRTCARYLDAVNFEGNQNPFGSPDPSAEAPREIYTINRKVAENRDYIEFELAAAIDLDNVKIPTRQCISSICQWVYRGPECGYTGTAVFDVNDNPSNVVAATNFPAGDRDLVSGQSLGPNQLLTSTNRWYQAIMQTDGNFVVYNKALKAVWSTLTYGKGLSTLKYQEDGNLVIYDSQDRPTWNSYTQNQAAITSLTFIKLIPDNYPQGDNDTLQLVAAPNFPAGTSTVLSTNGGYGFKLYPGQSMVSANGWYQLLMQRDGNFVIYNKANVPVWYTGTNQPCYAWFQPDGNLVLYRYSDNSAIWNSGSYFTSTTSVAATNFTTGTTGILLPGSTSTSRLTTGQNLYSPNGWYRLTLQSDGNLVLYSKATSFTGPASQNYNVAIWNSDTVGSNATYAQFQADGNFVLYTAANVPVWYSNKGSYPQNAAKKLALQNDGNLVIYGIGSSTSTTTQPATNLPTGTGEIICSAAETSKLYKGQTLYTTNGWYELTFQDDANLVLYDKAGKAIWNSGTYGTAGHYAHFQADGNLVIYNSTGTTAIWSLYGQYALNVGKKWKLSAQGFLALYDVNGAIVWTSGASIIPEPTITIPTGGSEAPLWYTATASLTEPRTETFPTSTLTLNNNGALTITSGATTRWTSTYTSTIEPQVAVETGDNRQHAFLWEVMGSADAQSGTTKTVNYTYTAGTRSITLSFTATANFTLPVGHYSGQTLSWTLTASSYVSSSGKWYLDEFLDLLLTTSESNPFRNHPFGTLSPTGRQYRIDGVLSSAGSLILENTGTLIQYDVNNNPIWTSGYSTTVEPKVPVTGPGTFEDVCGKRLSSCKVRFGDNAELPFGSFPGVGQYYA